MVKISAGIIEYNGKYLIGRRRLDKSFGGLWEFPGGKIEVGELPEETLKREIKEEFDIDIEVGAYFMTSDVETDIAHLSMQVFFAKWDGQGKIKICDHEEFKFIDLSELDNFKFAPADLPIIKKLKGLDQ